MEVPLIIRQPAFKYPNKAIYEQVVNELHEVNIDNEILQRSVPALTKSKSESEQYNQNCIKVNKSYSY